jgi:RNA methyltransferase, TrmH family
MKIQPASKNQIKSWKKLQLGKHRKKDGLFIAEGIRCVNQIIENRVVEIESILTVEGSNEIDELIIHKAPIFSLTKSDFDSISDTETPQGITAVCRIPEETTINKISATSGLVVAFDAIQDPGNLGTMIRTASWFGVSGLLIGKGTVDPFHPKVVRSTAGATGTIPFVKGDLDKSFTILEKFGYLTFLLDGSDQSIELTTLKPPEKSILVVGNEANGLHPKLFINNRTPVKIGGNPDRVESLNAAVALSIGLYHFTSK